MSRVLVVDDEAAICWGLERLVRAMGHRVDSASNAEQGLTMAAAVRPDLVVLDVRLPGIDGLTAMESFRRHIGAAPIIIMTAFGDLETAVKAVDGGAFEYVVKPFELAEIRAAIDRALRSQPPGQSRSTELADLVAPPAGADGMLGSTPVMRAVFKQIALAAASDAAVLLGGEAGVGKELAARAIHRHSGRRAGPFVAVSAAALSEELAEAELFGVAAGAVDSVGGAGRRGLLAQADGGTLFLDEPADLPLPIQARLVRALDDGEALPVGAASPVKTSVRIISATRRDPQELVRAGALRNDLYLRLGTFELSLPALRERADDIPLLARHFAVRFGARADALAQETLDELQHRPWYGNVRELQGAIEHALVVARHGVVLPNHLPAPLPRLDMPLVTSPDVDRPALDQAVAALAETLLSNPAAAGGVYEKFLEEVEPPLLATALLRNGNRCAPAARVLGLHRTTLKRKLDQYGIDESPAERSE